MPTPPPPPPPPPARLSAAAPAPPAARGADAPVVDRAAAASSASLFARFRSSSSALVPSVCPDPLNFELCDAWTEGGGRRGGGDASDVGRADPRTASGGRERNLNDERRPDRTDRGASPPPRGGRAPRRARVLAHLERVVHRALCVRARARGPSRDDECGRAFEGWKETSVAISRGALDDEQRVRVEKLRSTRRALRRRRRRREGSTRLIFSTRGAAMFYGYVLRRASRRAVHP
jgi:hypothetical protein